MIREKREREGMSKQSLIVFLITLIRTFFEYKKSTHSFGETFATLRSFIFRKRKLRGSAKLIRDKELEG